MEIEYYIILGSIVIGYSSYILMWFKVYKMEKPYKTEEYKEHLKELEEEEIKKRKTRYEDLNKPIKIPIGGRYQHMDIDGTNYLLFPIVAMTMEIIFKIVAFDLVFYPFMLIFIITLPISVICCLYVTFRSSKKEEKVIDKKKQNKELFNLFLLDLWVLLGYYSVKIWLIGKGIEFK